MGVEDISIVKRRHDGTKKIFGKKDNGCSWMLFKELLKSHQGLLKGCVLFVSVMVRCC